MSQPLLTFLGLYEDFCNETEAIGKIHDIIENYHDYPIVAMIGPACSSDLHVSLTFGYTDWWLELTKSMFININKGRGTAGYLQRYTSFNWSRGCNCRKTFRLWFYHKSVL